MLRTLALALGATASLLVILPAAQADELTAVYAQILADPTNSELSLQYAALAEARHEYRKALSAYERILVNDPKNQQARDGLQRVRRIIQPAETQTSLEIGTTWQSNVLRSPIEEDDVLGYGSFRIKDERPGTTHRWRTNIGVYGEAYADHGEMNYASLNGDIGPIIDIEHTNFAFRPAVGAGTAYFDGSLYYGDVNATGLFEGYLNGAYQWLRFRAGYRDYSPSGSSGSGAYADITGRWTIQDVFHNRDAFAIAPWVRWSGIDGDGDTSGDEFTPGRYIEGGATFEYAKAVTENLNASVRVKVSDKLYDDLGSGSRRDWYVSPGASLVFKNVFGPQTDIRLDYRYEWNTSNQPDHTWLNQAATIAFVIRR
jgi:hypothetical protein